MDLEFGVAAYRRDRGNLPELPLVNMLVETAKTEPKQVCIQSRPGLIDNNVTSGTDDVVAVFQKDGVCGGDLFTVTQGASTKLFREGALVGTITGLGAVSMAGNEIGLVVNAGSDVHYYSGTALAAADFPDGADVCKVLEIAGRFIGLRSGTQKFYWTETLESALVAGILTFGGLAFASAENEPDQLLDAVVVDDKLFLAGTETIELWSKTGDDDLPFSPIEGLVFEKGVKATGCMQVFDNTAVFVSDNDLTYRISSVPQRISDAGIEERTADSTTAKLFTFFWEGHELLCLRLDVSTMVYDAQTEQWCEFASEGETNWLASCACNGPVFGGPDGKTLVFGDTHYEMNGPLERMFAAGLAMNGGALSVNRLSLRTNPGNAELTGDYTNPVVEMRVSRDGGRTYGTWRPAQLGMTGEYRKSVEWRALGMFDHPGILVQFRVTDPVDFRVSGVSVNEPRGGRARD